MSNIPNKAPNVITAAGAITPANFNSFVTSAAVAATLALPTIDGIEAWFTDESGYAQTITVPLVGSPATAGLNGGAKTLLTWNGAKGSSVGLMSRNGSWWILGLNGVTAS